MAARHDFRRLRNEARNVLKAGGTLRQIMGPHLPAMTVPRSSRSQVEIPRARPTLFAPVPRSPSSSTPQPTESIDEEITRMYTVSLFQCYYGWV